MTQIDNKFKVKRGLEVAGDATFLNNLSVVGDINIPTLPATENSTKAASTAFVAQAVANLVNAAPAALNTLNELAAALGNDANFAADVNASIALKATIDSPTFTGIPNAPSINDLTNNTTQVATTAFVQAQKASMALTGIPTVPNAPVDTNNYQIANTAFVIGQAATVAPLMNGVVSVGTSTRYARQDHIHASDTSKANLAGDTFTGTVNFVGLTTTGNISLSGSSVVQNTNSNLAFKSSSAGTDIVFSVASSELVRFKSGGNVLIGTSADNTVDKLQVNGTVSATTFKGGAALTGTPTAPNAAAGTNSTQIANTAYVDAGLALKANAANPTFTGNTTFAGGIASNDLKFAPFVGGGNYTTSTATVTGAFKITLPVLYNSTMLQFTLSVFEYGGQKSFDLVLSGYNYSGTPTWTNTSAYMVGDTLARTPNVRFGNDGTNCCIWIGETTDTWSYPQINVKDVKFGFSGQSSLWLNGWSIAPVTTFDTVKSGPRVPFRAASVDSQTFTGTPRVPNLAANNNSTQIANTAYVDSANALNAPLASPALTGTPTAPTAVAGTNTTQIATTQFVSTAVANLVGAAPAALDTLNELAAALGGDANFAADVNASIALKAPLASPALTGIPTAPTAATSDNSTQIATTQFVNNQGYAKVADNYAKVASPTFTGSPSAPTPTPGDRTTNLATTDFVHTAINAVYTKNVAGGSNIAMTNVEALNRVIIFTGALTNNIVVTFPSLSGMWTIINNTSGAFTLTVQLASGGSAVVVAQSYSNDVVSTAANMVLAQTDYTNVYLAGAPTTTTATSTDSSTRVATTAFVKNQNYLITTSTIDGGSF